MVVYPNRTTGTVSVPPVTGGQVSAQTFVPWRPSTWPPPPTRFNPAFHGTLKRIFQETMLDELHKVARDIQTANATQSPMLHRGHVIAVAYMCALDAVASYGYKNRHVKKFIRNHFPKDYKSFASRIYTGYRVSLVHLWNLFGNASLLPGSEQIAEEHDGTIRVGIMNFVDAFEKAVTDFLRRLETEIPLQERALSRYREVVSEIKPSRPNPILVPGMIGFGIGVVATLLVELALHRFH